MEPSGAWSDNLVRARAALADLEQAVDVIRGMLGGAPIGAGVEEELQLAAMVEVARRARRDSDDLVICLACEALDHGVPPAMLDWAGG